MKQEKQEQKETEVKQEETTQEVEEWQRSKFFLDIIEVDNIKKYVISLKDSSGKPTGKIAVQSLLFESVEHGKNVNFYPSIRDEVERTYPNSNEKYYEKITRKPFINELDKLFPLYSDILEVIKKKGKCKLQMTVREVTPPNGEMYREITYKNLQEIDILKE